MINGFHIPCFGGIKIIESRMLPRKETPRSARIPGHPAVQWLAHQLVQLGITFDPDVTVRWIEYDEPNILYIQSTNTIIAPPSAMARLRREFSA